MEEKGRFIKPGELVDSLARLHQRNTERTRNDEPVKAAIASGYTGGDPTVLLPGETSASSSTKKCLVPIGWALPHANDEIVVLPLGNDFVVMGRVLSCQAGSPDTGAYYLMPNGTQPETTTTYTSTVANSVRVLKVLIPAPITVTSVIIEVTTATASAKTSIGIYGSAGTTLVLDTATIDCSSTGVKTATLGTAVYLPPAWYWYAFTINDTTTALRAVTTVGANITNLLNQGTVLKGAAANTATDGTLPSTLGSVTSSALTSLPFAKLQG